MTTIFERIETALTTISPAVPFAMDIFKTVGTLPDQYLVHKLIIGTPEQHADDAETARTHLVQVSIYSRTGLVSLPNVDGAMLAAGFQPGDFRPIPQDPDTGHFGLAKDYTFLEGA